MTLHKYPGSAPADRDAARKDAAQDRKFHRRDKADEERHKAAPMTKEASLFFWRKMVTAQHEERMGARGFRPEFYRGWWLISEGRKPSGSIPFEYGAFQGGGNSDELDGYLSY